MVSVPKFRTLKRTVTLWRSEHAFMPIYKSDVYSFDPS